MEKVIILGNGIAGLTAAIYAARATLSPLVISGPQSGGQLTMTTEVENFPGFPEGVQGLELTEKAKAQAEKFGARFKEEIATKFEEHEGNYKITLSNKEELITESLIIATGASARWLGIESEKRYKGRGVGTCATCDGFFYRGKEVLVVGGGDSAMEESNFLTKFANKVTVIHRRDEFRASKIMQDRFFKNPKTDVIWNKEIHEILGDEQGVTGAKLKDTQTGEITEIKCDGVFLALGHIPNTNIFKDKIDLDEKGYLKTDRDMNTNLKGVFGAGDVQDIRFRQAITAAGSGCMAAMQVEKYLESKE
ncbi:thioredoxin-disulfide reductase [Candidatus Woesearchaeota archaeon]|nr:thioredoxin-disulfide reductase [Candidatus Woesearchaeota archaeon]